MLSRLFPQKKSILVGSRLIEVRLPTLDDFAYFESWCINRFGNLHDRILETNNDEEKSLLLKKTYDSLRDGSSIDQDPEMMDHVFSSVDGLTIVFERLTSLSATESRLFLVSATESEIKQIVNCFFDNLTPQHVSRMIDRHLGISNDDFEDEQSERSLEDYALILANKGFTFDYIKTLTIPQLTELLTVDQEDYGAYDRIPVRNYEADMKLRWKWHKKYAKMLKKGRENANQSIGDFSDQRYRATTVIASNNQPQEFCNGSQSSETGWE